MINRLDTLFATALHNPGHGFFRVVDIELEQLIVDAPVVELGPLGAPTQDAGGSGLVLQHEGSTVAVCRDARLFLQAAHGCAIFDGGQDGRHARAAGAHNHNVVGLFSSEFGDGVKFHNGVVEIAFLQVNGKGEFGLFGLGSGLGRTAGKTHCSGSSGSGGNARHERTTVHTHNDPPLDCPSRAALPRSKTGDVPWADCEPAVVFPLHIEGLNLLISLHNFIVKPHVSPGHLWNDEVPWAKSARRGAKGTRQQQS